MSLDALDVVNAATLEKLVLTRRIATFLNEDQPASERMAIENVARLLAQDISVQVREALAFELRTCELLPQDLAAKIAADVEAVSRPFLKDTEAFTDQQLADLIPQLEEHAHVSIARRANLGPQACLAIVSFGSGKAVTFVVQNDHITLAEDACEELMGRFSADRQMMNKLARRIDLPISIVERIISHVSEDLREGLIAQYGLSVPVAQEIARATKYGAIWRQIEKASPSQVHAYVIDLRNQNRLTTDMVLEFAGNGCLSFMESALALEAGLTLGAVREALYGRDMSDFVRLMQQADISKAAAHDLYQIVSQQIG